MLLEISGEITPERMKLWKQSKNNTQLWMGYKWSVLKSRLRTYSIGESKKNKHSHILLVGMQNAQLHTEGNFPVPLTFEVYVR